MSKQRLKIKQTEKIVKETEIICDNIQEQTDGSFFHETIYHKKKRIQHIAIGVGIVSILIVACVFCVCFVLKQTTDTLDNAKKALEAVQERTNSVTQESTNVTNVNVAVNKTPTMAVEETKQEETDSIKVVKEVDKERVKEFGASETIIDYVLVGQDTKDTDTSTASTRDMSWTLNLSVYALTYPEECVFEIFKENEDGDEVRIDFSREKIEDNGLYCVDDAGSIHTVSPAHSGELIIAGFPTGTYRIREIKTQSGISVIKNSFYIIFPEAKGESVGLCVNECTDNLYTVVDENGNGVAYVEVSHFNLEEFELAREKDIATHTTSKFVVIIFSSACTFFCFLLLLWHLKQSAKSIKKREYRNE